MVEQVDESDRAWSEWAIGQVEADANRSADTHLLPFPLPAEWGINLYLKDESVHPTGSLKHRLARSLVLYGLCNNWINQSTTLVEASSGSTAVSEAYFARLIKLPFVAATTVREKCELIEFYGGQCKLVENPTTIYQVAADLAVVGITSISSPMPNEPPTGAAITTLPSRCLIN
jgi:cysteine synthase A